MLRFSPLQSTRFRGLLVIGSTVIALAGAPALLSAQGTQMAPAQGSTGTGPPDETVPNRLTADVLLGTWCGDTTNYTFSSTELTVTFHTGGTRVLRIDHIDLGDAWIDVHWVGKRPDGSSNNTVFAEFSADRSEMYQSANVGGDKGPRRRFRRC